MNIPDTLPAGQYAIYALIDPTDELVYYVGQTRKPTKRLAEHLAARHHKGAKGDWLRGLQQKDKQPMMLVLEVVSGEETALAKEREWAQHFLEWAISLWLSGLQTTRLPEEKQALALLLKQDAAGAIKRAFSWPTQTFPGLPLERIGHLYVLLRRLRSQQSIPFAESLAALAAEFAVPDVTDLPEAAWPDILAWFHQRLQND